MEFQFGLPDPWAADVENPGIILQAEPSSGVLGPLDKVAVIISVYADCWGLYREQIHILIEKLEPMVIDVWIEAVGAPLTFAMQPPSLDGGDLTPTLWISSSDPDRVVRVKNTSRSDLVVHSYVLRALASEDVLPLRLYLRFYDIFEVPCSHRPKSKCTSVDTIHGDSEESLHEKVRTGMELYLSADFGVQEEMPFKVKPVSTTIAPNTSVEFCVSLTPLRKNEIIEDGVLMLRTLPVQRAGPFWHRFETHPQKVYLKLSPRESLLQVSVSEVTVKLNALDLLDGEIMRVRNSLKFSNVGNGYLNLKLTTDDPWSLIQDGGSRQRDINMSLPPSSSNERKLPVKNLCWNYATPPPHQPGPLYFLDSNQLFK
ncbi:hypothetical protein ACJJTC_005329 [Scirpophaga incertulas]